MRPFPSNILLAFLVCHRILRAQCLVHVAPVEVVSTPSATLSSLSTATTPQSLMGGEFLLSSINDERKIAPGLPFSTKSFKRDIVIRVLDGNTIKLSKSGLVSLAGVRMPTPGSSNFQFPECLSYSPTYKLRQLLPPHTTVLIETASSSSKIPIPAVLIRSEDYLIVNQEIVRCGFGKVVAQKASDQQQFLDYDLLRSLQDEAKRNGLGIFKLCDKEHGGEGASFEAEFEPLELTVETQWGEDGGKQIVRKREDTSQEPPKNPGDSKGTSPTI